MCKDKQCGKLCISQVMTVDTKIVSMSVLHFLQDLGVISAASWLHQTHILEAVATAADISANNNDGLGRSE